MTVNIDKVEGIFFGLHVFTSYCPVIRISLDYSTYVYNSVSPTFYFDYITWDTSIVNSISSDILIFT